MEESAPEPDCSGEERTELSEPREEHGSGCGHRAVQEGGTAQGLGWAPRKTAVKGGIPWEGGKSHLQVGAMCNEE